MKALRTPSQEAQEEYTRECEGYAQRGLRCLDLYRVALLPDAATALCEVLDIVHGHRAEVFYRAPAGWFAGRWMVAPWLGAMLGALFLDQRPTTAPVFNSIDRSSIPVIGQWVLATNTPQAREDVLAVFEVGGREALRWHLHAMCPRSL